MIEKHIYYLYATWLANLWDKTQLKAPLADDFNEHK